MNIIIPLSRLEWRMITNDVLIGCIDCKHKRIGNIPYSERLEMYIHNELMRSVYIKLHNKLHSLKDKNKLQLTIPEAAVFGLWLQKSVFEHSFDIPIIKIIDQKLI